MKSFFKIILLSLFLTISILSNSSTLYSESIDLTGSIQGVQKETVVLVANNVMDGEICSNTGKESTNYLNSIPLVVSFNAQSNLFEKNRTTNNKSFIHNLSTDKQKVQQIRAP